MGGEGRGEGNYPVDLGRVVLRSFSLKIVSKCMSRSQQLQLERLSRRAFNNVHNSLFGVLGLYTDLYNFTTQQNRTFCLEKMLKLTLL